MRKTPPSDLGPSERSLLPNEKLRISNAILRAIAHPLRIKILRFIDENRGANVNRIYTSLHLEQSIVSQHLRILRQAGIVQTSRSGKFIHYSIVYERVAEIVKAIGDLFDAAPMNEG